MSSQGNFTLVNEQMTAASGWVIDSFNISQLPSREFTAVKATFGSHSDTKSYHFIVLGDWLNTCYNTPKEADFSGSTKTVGTTTSSCIWSDNEFKISFLDEVNENGSGIASSGSKMQLEDWCLPAPEGKVCHNAADICAFYRYPASSIQGSCGVEPQANHTIAVQFRDGIGCDSRIYIHGIGERFVEDAGGDLSLNQADHYMGSGNTCSSWTNPTRKAIKLFD